MSDFFGKIKSGANKVAFEAEKVARVTRAKNDLEQLKSKVKEQYTKLGELYYQKRSSGVTGPEFDALTQAVAELEAQMKAKDEEIQKINAETFEAQTPAPAATPTTAPLPAEPPTAQAASSSGMPSQVNAPAQTKVCPACGKEIPAGVKFCPECGKAV